MKRNEQIYWSIVAKKYTPLAADCLRGAKNEASHNNPKANISIMLNRRVIARKIGGEWLHADYTDKKKLEDLAQPWVHKIIAENFVGAKKIRRVKPNTQDDIDGIDYYVDMDGGTKRIDVKARDHDFGLADVVLEIYSNVENQTPGWTLDTTKKTDIVIFVCVDTGYYHIFPYPQLQRVFSRYWQHWDCQKIRQKTRDNRPGRIRDEYHSEAMIVPVFNLQCAFEQTFRRRR